MKKFFIPSMFFPVLLTLMAFVACDRGKSKKGDQTLKLVTVQDEVQAVAQGCLVLAVAMEGAQLNGSSWALGATKPEKWSKAFAVAMSGKDSEAPGIKGALAEAHALASTTKAPSAKTLCMEADGRILAKALIPTIAQAQQMGWRVLLMAQDAQGRRVGMEVGALAACVAETSGAKTCELCEEEVDQGQEASCLLPTVIISTSGSSLTAASASRDSPCDAGTLSLPAGAHEMDAGVVLSVDKASCKPITEAAPWRSLIKRVDRRRPFCDVAKIKVVDEVSWQVVVEKAMALSHAHVSRVTLEQDPQGGRLQSCARYAIIP